MDQSPTTPPTKKTKHFKQLLLAGLYTLIMACLVFFVFPRRPLSTGYFAYLRTQREQIAATVPPTAEIQTPAPTPEPTPEPSYYPSVTLGTDTSSVWLAALNTAYHGHFVGVWGYTSIEWPLTQDQIKEMEVEGLNSHGWEFAMYFTSIIGSTPLIENGVTKEFVVTQSQVDPKYSDWSQRAILSGAVLAEKDGQWSVESLQRYLAIAGQAGRISQPIVINIGKNHPAFQLNDKFNEQGGMHGTLATYAYINGSIRDVLHIDQAFGDNRPAFSDSEPNKIPIFTNDAVLEPSPSSKEFYDIRMTSTVTTFAPYWDKGSTYPAGLKMAGTTHAVSTYSFNGREYIKVPAGWQAYLDPLFNVSFGYPSDWQKIYSIDGGVGYASKARDGYFEVSHAYYQYDGIAVDNYYSRFWSSYPDRPQAQRLTINGHGAFLISPPRVDISHANEIDLFLDCPGLHCGEFYLRADKDHMQQIIQTMKIQDATSPADTSALPDRDPSRAGHWGPFCDPGYLGVAPSLQTDLWERALPDACQALRAGLPANAEPIEESYSIKVDEEKDLTGDGIPEAMINTGAPGASTAFSYLFRLDNGKPVLAQFGNNGTVSPIAFSSGGTVTHGSDVVLMTEKHVIYQGGWGTNASGELFGCTVEAYQWDPMTKIFQFKQAMSSELQISYCKKIQGEQNPTKNHSPTASTSPVPSPSASPVPTPILTPMVIVPPPPSGPGPAGWPPPPPPP